MFPLPKKTVKGIYVGLDFGTTSTSVSYVDGHGHLHLIDFEGQYQSGAKFPSRVAIREGNLVCGWDIPAEEKAVEWTKLELLHPDDQGEELRASSLFQEHVSFRRSLGLRADKVVEEIFRYAWKRFLSHFHRFAERPDATYQFFLTVAVPAQWPAYARNAMRKAVADSGIASHLRDDVKFVSEPEATMMGIVARSGRLQTSGGSKNSFPIALELGQRCLVVDCGGATVDIGHYEVLKLDPLCFRELAPSAIQLNGALKLDDRFIEQLGNVTHQMPLNRDFVINKATRLQHFARINWYNDLKLCYDGNLPSWQADVPGRWLLASARTGGNAYPQLTLTREQLVYIFKPLTRVGSFVQDQIRLVRETTGKLPDCVFISGGYGQNQLVRQTVARKVEEIASDTRAKIQVVSVWQYDALAAVSRGAALQCQILNRATTALVSSGPQVESRISQASFGLRSTTEACQYDWIICEGGELSATRPFVRSVELNAFKHGIQENGTPKLTLGIYSQKSGQEPRLYSEVEWYPEATLEELQAQTRAIQLRLTYGGVVIRPSIVYQNEVQDGDQVKTAYYDV